MTTVAKGQIRPVATVKWGYVATVSDCSSARSWRQIWQWANRIPTYTFCPQVYMRMCDYRKSMNECMGEWHILHLAIYNASEYH
jgi:hypothetical protein